MTVTASASSQRRQPTLCALSASCQLPYWCGTYSCMHGAQKLHWRRQARGGTVQESCLGWHIRSFLWTGEYLGEVDELLEELGLQVGGAGLGVGQVEVAGNLGNQGRVAIVLAVPAGRARLTVMYLALDSMGVTITSMKEGTSSEMDASARVKAARHQHCRASRLRGLTCSSSWQRCSSSPQARSHS